MQDWLWMTAADLGRAIGAGDIDPIALTDVYLDAIDAHEHRDRIYARVTHDRARYEAKSASERAKLGMRRGPLDGVPISWKDLFDTADTATEAGTALMEGRVPDADAEVLQVATSAGLVCLGKTHMSEIAFSGLGLNPITATTAVERARVASTTMSTINRFMAISLCTSSVSVRQRRSLAFELH